MARADEPFDPVEKPKHYNVHPSGIECIELIELMRFSPGNVIKYVWRSGQKEALLLQDYRKAEWYLKRTIEHDKQTEDSFGLSHVGPNLVRRRQELVERIAPHHPEHLANMLRCIVSAESETSRFRRARLFMTALVELQIHIAICEQEK
jgi:hypothetical protein